MKEKVPSAATVGPWIAMAAAVILTAKGEFDLAVLAHFSAYIAWMFPVMIDVYVITAFHRRRWADMVIGMLLMIFCQIAVHLLPVYITTGEETPWGLVVAVACIAPIVVVRVKMLTGRTGKEIEAAEKAAERAEELRTARAETAAAKAAQVAAEKAARAETARAEAEAAARAKAETRAAQAEKLAHTQAEKQAEIEAATEAEIAEHARAAAEAADAVRVAEQRVTAATEAAALAEGRLAEARDTADRANTARALTEKATAEQVQALTDAAEQAERDHQQALAEARYTSQAAQERAAELDESVRVLRAQLDEAQRVVERLATARAVAEQESQAIKDGRDGLVNELERTRRALARAQERAETNPGRQPEIVRPATRKSLASVPAELPADLPEVETVKPETVAAVLIAKAENPHATQAALKVITGISERTIRKVLNTVPAEIVGQVLELTA